jgi:Ca2+ transporting ATPase
VKKSDDKPFMLSGTSIMKGTGSMLITCVGLFSEEGIIQKLITGVGEEEVGRVLANVGDNPAQTARLETLDANVRSQEATQSYV